MATISDYFTEAELAFAAYADLLAGITGDPYVIALQNNGKGLTLTQAAEFVTRWRVVAQYDGKVEETYIDEFGQEHVVANPTGVSATVFESVAEGKRYLVIRGTNDLSDIVTDFVDIAVLGTPERQAQYAALKGQVGAWLSDGTLTAGFTVSGHSLGGFLAGALLVDYPGEISHAYLYNAPGIGGLSAGLRLLAGLETEPTLDLAKVSNLIAEAGPSLTAGLGLDWGVPVAIAIENQTPDLFGNHSIKHLTDSLAVYDLFARVDPSVSVETVSAILNAAANENAPTLETALSMLGALYGRDYPAGETSRDALYTHLYDLRGAIGSNQGTVVSLVGLSNEQLVALAQADIGCRYALEQLLPFAVTGNGGLYAGHNGDGHLDADVLTDRYLEDRAAMLFWKLRFDSGAKDDNDLLPGDKSYGEEWDSLGTTDDWKYTDGARGLTLTVDGNGTDIHHIAFGSGTVDTLAGAAGKDHLYGMAGDDELAGHGGDDYLEGGEGQDILDGGKGADTLVGSVGDDTLIGGDDSEADILEGGAGNDTYYAGENDLVIDTDHSGTIFYNGSDIAGMRFDFLYATEGDEYCLEAASGVTVRYDIATATLSGLNGFCTISGYGKGDFGVNLAKAPPVLPPAARILAGSDGPDATAAAIVSSEGRYGFSGTISGGQASSVLSGWQEFSMNGAAPPPDLQIDGGADNDSLIGLAGGDTISGGSGNDWAWRQAA